MIFEIGSSESKKWAKPLAPPYSETYLYTIHAQLTTLFNYAQTFYGLRFNPCDASGYMGSSVAGEMLIITKDQYELLRKEFRNEAYLLAFDILFWTGCREGEMLALLPKDLTDDDQLRIYKTYHRKKGRTSLAPPRTAKKEATEMYLFHIGWPKNSAPTVPGSTG